MCPCSCLSSVDFLSCFICHLTFSHTPFTISSLLPSPLGISTTPSVLACLSFLDCSTTRNKTHQYNTSVQHSTHSDFKTREREMFYLTTHSTHFIYGYMASDIWLRTILIVRKETRCRHIGYSY